MALKKLVLKLLHSDESLKMKTSLYGTLILNAAYAALQLGMGLRHRSFWFI